MGKIFHILKRKDVGAIGIGAMIIFIAMVLVAGIAASVLVQTANKLEIQAMMTGDQTTDEVATGLAILDILGHRNGTADIDYLAITIATRAGSGDVDLEQTYVEIADGVTKNVLTYDSTEVHMPGEVNADLFKWEFFDGLSGIDFGVVVLEDADSSFSAGTPVINRGDKVMLLINCTVSCALGRNIPERTDVWGLIQPEDGAAGVFNFRSPAAYTDVVMDLY